MANEQVIAQAAVQEVVRQALLDKLIDQIDEDPYPSVTMMDMAEELLSPWDVERYADVLLAKVKDDRFPSIPMLKRIRDLVGV